jgi:ribosomal protein S12
MARLRCELFRANGRLSLQLVSVCLVALAASGCLAGTNGAESTPQPKPSAAPTSVPTASPSPTPPSTLDSTLVQLVNADNRTAYAERHGITLDEGRVRVLIGLRESTPLPDDFDTSVELRHETEVIAFVAVSDLVALSRHENVTVVRVPDRPYPAGDDRSHDSTPESFRSCGQSLHCLSHDTH